MAGARAPREDGFTLIELLLTLVVLGILAAIVLIGTGTIRGSADTASCGTDYKSLKIAVTAYYTKYGNYLTPDGQSVITPDDLANLHFIEKAPTSASFTIGADGSITPTSC